MKADDACAEHPLENLVSPRTNAEALRIEPRDIPEHDDGGSRKALANEPRCQGEMVILHQDNRVGRIDLGANGIRELFVDLPVMPPILTAKYRTGIGDVTQRP